MIDFVFGIAMMLVQGTELRPNTCNQRQIALQAISEFVQATQTSPAGVESIIRDNMLIERFQGRDKWVIAVTNSSGISCIISVGDRG